MTRARQPVWMAELLAEPGGDGTVTVSEDRIISGTGAALGVVTEGILRFGVNADDPSIRFYQTLGGADFHERSKVAFAMTSLDTPVYADYLRSVMSRLPNGLVADVGGGDGRNAMPWLSETSARVVVIDPILDGLIRFRRRLEAQSPELLERVGFIQADARKLPLRAAAFDAVQDIEALYYLNEEYEVGLRECRRVMKDSALFTTSDRDYEGGLLMRLLYFGGVAGMLEYAGSRNLWDGLPDFQVRSRCFTREELVATVQSCGLSVVEQHGISSLSLVISYLRSIGKVGGAEEEPLLARVYELLKWLGKNGRMMRCHVLICRKAE